MCFSVKKTVKRLDYTNTQIITSVYNYGWNTANICVGSPGFIDSDLNTTLFTFQTKKDAQHFIDLIPHKTYRETFEIINQKLPY